MVFLGKSFWAEPGWLQLRIDCTIDVTMAEFPLNKQNWGTFQSAFIYLGYPILYYNGPEANVRVHCVYKSWVILSPFCVSRTTEGEFNGVGKKGNAPVQMARILQYLECPQYLRKSFFPCHSDLKYAGRFPSIDTSVSLRNRAEKTAVRWYHLTHQFIAGARWIKKRGSLLLDTKPVFCFEVIYNVMIQSWETCPVHIGMSTIHKQG